MVVPEPHSRPHRPSRLTVSKDDEPVVTQPHIVGGGGVGWRPGVPHIVIHAGDTYPTVPFPVGYEFTEYVEPLSPAGRPVPLATVRRPAYDHGGWEKFYPQFEVGEDPDTPLPPGAPTQFYGYWDWTESSLGVVPNGTWDYERCGTVDKWWISPSNAATLPATLKALADIDIRLVALSHNSFNLVGGPGPGIFDSNEFSYAEFIQQYEEDPLDIYDMSTAGIGPGETISDMWGPADDQGIHHFGAAMAALTGAILGEELMSYAWNDPMSRWIAPTSSNASSFADFLVPRLLQLADSVATDRRMDIALCVDSSGSFGSAQNIAAQVFRDIITRLRAEEVDIYVAVSRFEEYSWASWPYAAESMEGRPFILQYPLAPINDDFSYNNMLLTLSDDTPGGGGDTPETQIEAFYQIATGAGFDGTYDWKGPGYHYSDPNTPVQDIPQLPTHDGEMMRSGEAGVRGLPLGVDRSPAPMYDYLITPPPEGPGMTAQEADEFVWKYWDTFGVSQGLGYMAPGFSGDVPPYGAGVRAPHGTAFGGDLAQRLTEYYEKHRNR